MKCILLMLMALSIVGCATPYEKPVDSHKAYEREWVLLKSKTKDCYAFRYEHRVSPNCYPLRRKAVARMEQVRSYLANWPIYESNKWDDL